MRYINLRTLKVTQLQLFDDLGGVFNGPKIIYITIAKAVSLYLITWSLTAVRADVICFERMVVEKWLEFDMKRDLKGFLCSFSNQKNVRSSHLSLWHWFSWEHHYDEEEVSLSSAKQVLCTRRIQFPLQNINVVFFSNNFNLQSSRRVKISWSFYST